MPLHRLGRNRDILQNQWSFVPFCISKSWPRSEMVAISGLYPLHFWRAQPARSATQCNFVTRRGGFQAHGGMGLGRERTKWHGDGLRLKLPSCYTDPFCPCFRGCPQLPMVLLPPIPGCWGGEGCLGCCIHPTQGNTRGQGTVGVNCVTTGIFPEHRHWEETQSGAGQETELFFPSS